MLEYILQREREGEGGKRKSIRENGRDSRTRSTRTSYYDTSVCAAGHQGG